MAKNRPPGFLFNSNKKLTTDEAFEILSDSNQQGCASLPLRPEGGDVYLFQGNLATKDDWKSQAATNPVPDSPGLVNFTSG